MALPLHITLLYAVCISLLGFIFLKNLQAKGRQLGVGGAKDFRGIVREFKNKNVIYTTLKKFEDDLQKVFEKKLHITSARLVILNEKNRKSFERLVRLFEKRKGVLVLKDTARLSEVVIPLFHPSRGLSGFLALGEKSSGDNYSRKEIRALEEATPLLSLKLSETLFSSELRKRVSKKTENLRRQNGRIRELLQQQADFISVSAHELRTPLSIALLQTEILEHTLMNSGSKEKDSIKSAREALEKLQRLVQKLFNVQRHDLNKIGLNLKKIKIADFLSGIYKNFQPLMQDKSINFRFENKIPHYLSLKIDPLQMQQVLGNVLSNAKKFTPAGGRVTFRAQAEKNQILLLISDNGPGIPAESRSSIFEKFRSLHSSKGKGIGLGLYLCKKIIELHQGKIWVEESASGGAQFCIQLEPR
ncbi:MAG: HAMP domain-containing sensor histidine kinase [Patescibacteria group bacterium]